MRFLIDNALSPTLVEPLRDLGHDAVHVGTLGLAGATDEELFDLASNDDRVIVSADTDFGTLLAKRTAAKPSVVLFRAETTRVPSLQIELLKANLPVITEALLQGAMVVFDGKRIRIRYLPLLG